MNAKHTPGPWNSGTVEGNDSRYQQGVFSSRGRCIGVVYGKIDHKWTDEDRQNVRLFIAAPDLLQAVRDLELRMTQASLASGIRPRKNNTNFLLGELGRMGDVARAAIAKAKGE